MGIAPESVETYSKTIDGLCYVLNSDQRSAQVIYSSDHDNLRKINIPSTIEYGDVTYDVTSIGGGAFASSNSYSKSVSIPESVTSIGVGAFRSCILKSIVLPVSLEFIGDGAFANTRLTSIEIPENVKYIGKGVFSFCKNLSKIKVSEKNRKYDSRSNCNAIIETESNTLIQGCGGSTIPLGVTSIGAIAFSSTAIRDVIIPQGVTSIDSCAFLGCDSLKSVFMPNSVVTIGNSAFSSCRSLSNISFPNGACSIHNGAFNETAWYNAQPDGVVYAGKSVYKYKGNMHEGTNIVIKDGTLFVCNQAFQECSRLKSVKFPSTLTAIGVLAFYGCSGLKSITFPSSLTTIGSSAFWACSQLDSVFIPSSVVTIEGNPFPTCNNLAVITVDKNNKFYDSRGNCNAIIETKTNALIAGCKNTIIPNSIISIQNGAFYGCKELTSIAIPGTVTSIWKNSFYGCEGLKEVKSYIRKPFAINDSVFLNRYNSYKKATLYVPSGTKDQYLATDGWKNFKNIVEMAPEKGDIGGKGYTDVTDVVAAINHILGEQPLEESDAAVVDMNSDGEVNVADIILLVKMILEQGNNVQTVQAARSSRQAVDLTKFTAMQLSIDVPTGSSLNSIRLAGRSSDTHQLMYQQTADGSYIVVVWSMDNQDFSPADGQLIEVSVEGGGEAAARSVLLADRTGGRMTLDCLPVGTVTGIGTISTDGTATADVYDLRGNKVLQKGGLLKQLPKGVYVINGKKVIK